MARSSAPRPGHSSTLLGPLDGLDLIGIGWVIASGESGPAARPMRAEWIRQLRDACQTTRVPFFFKQWGGRTPKAAAGCSTATRGTSSPAR